MLVFNLDINIDDIYDSHAGIMETQQIYPNKPSWFLFCAVSSSDVSTDTIVVEYLPLPYIDIGDIFYLCNDDSLDLELSNEWATTLLVDLKLEIQFLKTTKIFTILDNVK